MSDAKKCDRCKKFYLETDDIQTRPTYAGVEMVLKRVIHGNKHIESYDLCAACALKLSLFLKGSDAE